MYKNILLTAMIFCFVSLITSSFVQAQNSQPHKQGPKDLHGAVVGKWNLSAPNSKNQLGMWEFQADGKFVSSGEYWGNKKGLFRTEESRSVIVIEIGENVTQWAATFSEEGILSIEEITEGVKKPSAKLLLAKVGAPH